MRSLLAWLVVSVCSAPLACGGRSHGDREPTPARGGSPGAGGTSTEGGVSSGGPRNQGGVPAGSAGRPGQLVSDGGEPASVADDPGDATCACDATGPACATWFATHCSGSTECAPQLSQLLQAANWGMPSSYNLDVTYSVCSDGTRWFTSQGFESAETFEFDADSRLVYEMNTAVGWVVCGAPEGGAETPSTANAACQVCEVLRKGGLEEASSGAGGIAGAAGEGGAPTDRLGRFYCLVDDMGQLVMPN